VQQPVDPASLIRSRQYRTLLVLAALIGLLVSAAAWCFLEGVHQIEVWVYEDLPHRLGYETAPIWWPLPWVALPGLLTALAIVRLTRARRPRARGRAQERWAVYPTN